MKMKRRVVGLVASALLVASMTTTAFAADSPSTDKVTPTCAPTKEFKCTGKEVKCTGKEGKSDKTGETVPVFPAAAAVCLAGATLFGTKIKFEEE